MGFLYVRSDEVWSRNGGVSLGVGVIDATYDTDWLVDGRTAYPLRVQGTSLTATITNPSGSVNLVALASTNVSVATTITGGVSGSIVAGALGEDGIRLNPFVSVALTAITTLTAAIATNANAVTVGELIAGRARTLWPGPPETDLQDVDFARLDRGESRSVQPFDRGLAGRTLKFSQIYTQAQLAELQSWQRSQRSGSLTSYIVPDDTVNDLWPGYLLPLKYRRLRGGMNLVQVEFIEDPRTRW